MGLFDKLKNAAKDAADIAKGIASSAAKDLAMMGNSPEAQAAREEAKKAEAARQAAEEQKKQEEKQALFNDLLENYDDYSDEHHEKWKKYLYMASDEEMEELERLIEEKRNQAKENCVKAYVESLAGKTNCDIGKGDCCWHGEHFFCTCGDADCPRKKYVKAKQMDSLFAEEHLPYVKVFASFRKERAMFEEDKWIYPGPDAGFGLSDVLRTFFATFLPEYEWKLMDRDDVLEYFYDNGLGRNNPALDILFTYKEKTGGKALPWFPTIILELEDRDLRQDFFKNPSLYDHGYQDFIYTAGILDIVSNPEKLMNYYTDTSAISVDQLYNADGTIKEAGIGGPKAGFYGDVIYNIVESWGGEEE